MISLVDIAKSKHFADSLRFPLEKKKKRKNLPLFPTAATRRSTSRRISRATLFPLFRDGAAHQGLGLRSPNVHVVALVILPYFLPLFFYSNGLFLRRKLGVGECRCVFFRARPFSSVSPVARPPFPFLRCNTYEQTKLPKKERRGEEMVGGCRWNSAKRNPFFFPGEREKELLQRFRQSESGKRFPFPPYSTVSSWQFVSVRG